MAFEYQPFVNPYGASMADLIARSGDAQAHAAEMTAAAQARAAEIRGQAWGGAVQAIGQIPQQIAAAKDAEITRKLKQEQLTESVQGRAEANRQRVVTTIGRLANGSKTPDEFMSSVDDMAGLGGLPKDVAAHIKQQVQSAGPDGWDAVRTKYVEFGSQYEQAIKLGEKERLVKPSTGQEIVPAVPQPVDLGPGHVLVQPPTAPGAPAAPVATAPFAPGTGQHVVNGQVVDATGAPVGAPVPKQPTNEAELAADAANPNSQTAGQSKTALDLLKDAKAAGSSGELKAGRLDGKMIFATFDPKTKRLTYQGQDVTDRMEPPRDPLEAQAATMAFQIAQQARAQAFTEAQAGRKELTEKVVQPYQTAKGSANTLRDVVAAAQAGNKVAGSLQSLETTMAAIRAQGLNRINTAEIGVTANAGNLWDRVVGWVGKAESGQPVPANIQKDMLEFADILDKAAYKKYAEGHRDIATRYGLKDEKPEPPPGAPADGTERTVNGETRVWGLHSGVWGWARK